ncbi:hypothetical protein ACFQLX_21240 [Streptomyces polyrhachis]|uniref:Uncharacterized protein n=1 Tax=Streptomyces polyrhachis TaxID=1282885 RepID=A0ABW2GIV6_9ACTN
MAASVGPDGQVVTLWAALQDLERLRSVTTSPGFATFPDARSARPVAARVSTHFPKAGESTAIKELSLAHADVQPLPDGRVLVVGARCRWRPEGPDRNAIIYDADGTVRAEATLGDGIEHLLTTRSGQVWVGYFDEGIFGNYGWGGPGPAGIGSSGLVRFSSDLEPTYTFPSDGNEPSGFISDCYALNVDGEDAWTSYYTDFPIVRVRDEAVAGWRNPVRGAKALAVDGTRVALFGGYGEACARLVVGELESEDFQPECEYRVVLPDGKTLPPKTQVIGRGFDLHFLTGDDWYRLDLEQIPRLA